MGEYSEAFVALDVAKTKHAVAIADGGRGGEVRFVGEIASSPAAVERLVHKLAGRYGKLHFCYEAGPTGYGLYRQIEALGHACLVVAPALIPKRPGERVKTNRRDAVTLARLHRAGELTGVWATHEAVRDLVRAREAAADDRRRKRQQLLSFLLRHGRVYSGGGHWTLAHRRWLAKQSDGSRYARCIPFADSFTTLSLDERRFVSQIQGRTYANIFGLVERFINAKVLEMSRDHALGDQEAVEALVRFSDQELKHQELFRRVEAMVGEVLPDGYRFDIDPNDVARAVLGKCTWAVLVLTLDIELFTQAHYRRSIDPDSGLSELFKDIFLYHWKEECQHALLDEIELARHDATLTAEERDRAVGEFIELVAAVDGILKAQSAADASYFVAHCGRAVDADEARSIEAAFLTAYRWQYIHSGAKHPHFVKVLSSLITESQGRRVEAALATLH